MRTAKFANVLGVIFVGVVGVAACAHDHEQMESSEPGSTNMQASSVSNDRAAKDITDERCDREKACNNIGSNHTYESVGACKRELGHDTRATLRQEECPNGVSGVALSNCLNDIRNERCGNPLDTLERVGACRKAKLCGG
jgi:hypothetical protein